MRRGTPSTSRRVNNFTLASAVVFRLDLTKIEWAKKGEGGQSGCYMFLVNRNFFKRLDRREAGLTRRSHSRSRFMGERTRHRHRDPGFSERGPSGRPRVYDWHPKPDNSSDERTQGSENAHSRLSMETKIEFNNLNEQFKKLKLANTNISVYITKKRAGVFGPLVSRRQGAWEEVLWGQTITGKVGRACLIVAYHRAGSNLPKHVSTHHRH